MTENQLLITYRSSPVCTLGLEAFSRSELHKRKQRRSLVTKAVLEAQEQQRIEGIKDPGSIAGVSRSISRTSVEEACLRANDDGTEVKIPRIEESIDDQDFVEIRI